MRLSILVLFFPVILWAKPDLKIYWKKGCEQIGEDYLSSQLYISSEAWLFTDWAFEDPGCQKKYLQFERVFRADLVAGDLDLQVKDVLYTPLTEEVAEALNLIGFCGLKNWQTGVSRSVIQRFCESVDNYQQDQMIFSIWKFDNEGIFVGQATPGFDGSSPDKRHQSLESSAYQKSK